MKETGENTINKIFTLPNILSFVRITMIPFIVWTYLVDEMLLSAILVLISGVTDVVDGFIARHFKMVSALGKALDPIADKLTQLAVLACLSTRSNGLTFLLWIFVMKEFIMGIQGLVIIKKTGTTYSARWYGKLTTLYLYSLMMLHIVWRGIPENLSLLLVVACDCVVTMSLVLYTIRNIKELIAVSAKNKL